MEVHMLKLGFVVVGSLFLTLALQTARERQFADSFHKPNSSPNAAMKEYVEQPKCRLKRVNAPLTINHLTPTALRFDDADYDTGEMADLDNYPTRITIQEEGVYILSGCINITGPTGRYSIGFLLNGVTSLAGTRNTMANDPFTYGSLTTQCLLRKGDYVEMMLAQNSGAPQIVQSLADSPVFCAARLP
jgi:hypothetical protein